MLTPLPFLERTGHLSVLSARSARELHNEPAKSCQANNDAESTPERIWPSADAPAHQMNTLTPNSRNRSIDVRAYYYSASYADANLLHKFNNPLNRLDTVWRCKTTSFASECTRKMSFGGRKMLFLMGRYAPNHVGALCAHACSTVARYARSE